MVIDLQDELVEYVEAKAQSRGVDVDTVINRLVEAALKADAYRAQRNKQVAEQNRLLKARTEAILVKAAELGIEIDEIL